MIPDYLSHLHGTPHGWWYYGCDCYPCYAAYERHNKRVPMTLDEWTQNEMEFESYRAGMALVAARRIRDEAA